MRRETQDQSTVADLTALVHQQHHELAELRAIVGRVQRTQRPVWRSPLALFAIVVLPLALSGVAMAAVPGAHGVLTGCYDVKTGALRVIDAEAGQTCTAGKEAQVSWSQTGPQGPQGRQGDTGAQGIQGLKGDTGAVGPQGIQGLPGPQGAQGIEGPQGVQGPAGVGGVSGYEVVQSQSELPANSHWAREAVCPAGKSVVSGGYTVSHRNKLVHDGFGIVKGWEYATFVQESRPSSRSIWRFSGATYAVSDRIDMYVVCATVAP
jgi:hypothetical protein